MTLSEDVENAGRQVANATGVDLANALNSALELFLNPPFKAALGRVVDINGVKSEVFSSIVLSPPPDTSLPMPEEFPSDQAAAVIDATEVLDLANFRSAYSRIASAKRLRKNPKLAEQGKPTSTITLGIILSDALRCR